MKVKKFKFKVGNFYRMRNGRKAFCAYVDNEKYRIDYPCVQFAQVGNPNVFWASSDGKVRKDKTEYEYDIVARCYK